MIVFVTLMPHSDATIFLSKSRSTMKRKECTYETKKTCEYAFSRTYDYFTRRLRIIRNEKVNIPRPRSRSHPEYIRLTDELFEDLETFQVFISGKRLMLTKKEFDILWLLSAHPGIVFTRTQILDSVWGCDYLGDIRTVDTHIKRLRAKTDSPEHPDWSISTVRGMGYKFEV